MANIKDLIQSIESGDSSFDEKLAAINAMEETLVAVRAKEQEAIDENVSLIVETIATMQRKVEAQLEVAKAIMPDKGDAGRDGQPGRDGQNGQDGRNGLDGPPGPAGADGEDGVSVVDAKIDFDGSLVIGLSSGREINVGEVVAADLAEKIKVTMSTNSTVVVQDEGSTITSGVRSLNFTGTGVTATASGDSVTVNVTGGGGGGSSTITISNKTAAYTVVAGDLGTVINCTSGTFTVSLTAAATLGAGFNVWVWNSTSSGTDVITIDPSGAETIDSKATLVLRTGEGTQIVCDGTNWLIGDKKTMRGYSDNFDPSITKPTASGYGSVAIGSGAISSGDQTLAFGLSSSATGVRSLAFHGEASSGQSTAIGFNSALQRAKTITGSGAMALGGSYASGTDSFAAAIANNTSTYGAQGANSVAMGYQSKATGVNSSVALGISAIASGTSSVSIGPGCTASATNSVAIGNSSIASGQGSFAFGRFLNTNSIIGKFVFGYGPFSDAGDSQSGKLIVFRATTDATPTVLTSAGNAPSATNQLILANNQAMTVTGTVICRQSVAGSDKASGWTFTAVIRRGANAASTALVAAVTPVLVAQDLSLATTVLAITADTTNGGLAVTVTGIAATNLRWVATIETSECTYA